MGAGSRWFESSHPDHSRVPKRHGAELLTRRSRVRFTPLELRGSIGDNPEEVGGDLLSATDTGRDLLRVDDPSLSFAALAHLVEHSPDKREVPSPNLGSRTVVVAQGLSAGLWPRLCGFESRRPPTLG